MSDDLFRIAYDWCFPNDLEKHHISNGLHLISIELLLFNFVNKIFDSTSTMKAGTNSIWKRKIK